ncbi:MAG: CBS domain-containing protein [Nocardioidaceae bacterium]
MRITDVLQTKGPDVVTIPPEAKVRDLVALLNERNIGAVVVSTPDRAVAAIVSERDVVRRLGADTAVLDCTVSDIMTTDVRTAEPSDSVHDLMVLMTRHRIRHVPVVSEGELCGIVSIGDVVKSRIGELEFERDQLSSYVSGSQ